MHYELPESPHVQAVEANEPPPGQNPPGQHQVSCFLPCRRLTRTEGAMCSGPDHRQCSLDLHQVKCVLEVEESCVCRTCAVFCSWKSSSRRRLLQGSRWGWGRWPGTTSGCAGCACSTPWTRSSRCTPEACPAACCMCPLIICCCALCANTACAAWSTRRCAAPDCTCIAVCRCDTFALQ